MLNACNADRAARLIKGVRTANPTHPCPVWVMNRLSMQRRIPLRENILLRARFDFGWCEIRRVGWARLDFGRAEKSKVKRVRNFRPGKLRAFALAPSIRRHSLKPFASNLKSKELTRIRSIYYSLGPEALRRAPFRSPTPFGPFADLQSTRRVGLPQAC